MINLEDMPISFRTQLARQSEPFFICYKKLDAFNSARKEIAPFLTKEDNTALEKEIQTLISATTQTIRYDSESCQLSLDWTKYAAANKITKKKISHHRMKRLILLLEDANLITFYKGFHYEFSNKKGVEKSMRSTIVFSEKWLSFFNVGLCKTNGSARVFDLVILKDAKGNVISHKGKRGVGVEKNFLKQWNTQLNGSVIYIDGMRVKPLYTTVFNNSSLSCGGRLFAGSFSNERSYLRSTIIIDGEKCTEVDYKNNHFRILYNKIGIDYQTDAYDIRGVDGWDSKELRKACKKAGVIMLNAKSRKSAQAALIKELSTKTYFNREGEVCDKGSEGCVSFVKEFSTIPNCKKTTDYIFDCMLEKHQPISDHFFKAEWDYLQNLDSLIAKQVVKAFLTADEICLTYHDSFLCVCRLQGFLINIMKEAWEIVLGSTDGFGYDVEF